MFGLHLWENIFHFSQITPKILDGCGEELKNWTKTWRPHNMGCAFPLYEVYEISAVHSGESIFVFLSLIYQHESIFPFARNPKGKKKWIRYYEKKRKKKKKKREIHGISDFDNPIHIIFQLGNLGIEFVLIR